MVNVGVGLESTPETFRAWPLGKIGPEAVGASGKTIANSFI
jgi:hypothetical protein